MKPLTVDQRHAYSYCCHAAGVQWLQELSEEQSRHTKKVQKNWKKSGGFLKIPVFLANSSFSGPHSSLLGLDLVWVTIIIRVALKTMVALRIGVALRTMVALIIMVALRIKVAL